MKYITLIIGLMAVGCGKQEQTDTDESTPTTTEKPVKELTKEDVVGTYEIKEDGYSFRLVLLEDGIGEGYENGKKEHGDAEWELVDGELHVAPPDEGTRVLKINKDGSITSIARIDADGKREEVPKERQMTLKKIK